MSMNQDSKLPPSLQDLEGEPDLSHRHLQRVGVIDRVKISHQYGKQIASVISNVNAHRARVVEKVSVTSLNLAEQRLTSTLLATTLVDIGALANMVNTQGAVIDQRSTSGAMAAIAANYESRHESDDLITSLYQSGRISADELAEMRHINASLTQQDAARVLERMQSSKGTVQSLIDYATQSIGNTRPRT